MEKTREIVEQWPNFPYYVPPSSKTGPKLKNPRSRVHIPTEGNGKPVRVCNRSMSAEAIACRKAAEKDLKRPFGGKRICKQDESEESKRCRAADKPEKSKIPAPYMPRPAIIKKEKKPITPGTNMSKYLRGEGKKKAKKSGKPKYDII